MTPQPWWVTTAGLVGDDRWSSRFRCCLGGLVHAATSPAAIDRFAAQQLDAAAGVRQPLQAWALDHPEHRVLPDSFTVIRQAVAVLAGRDAAAVARLHDALETIRGGNGLADAFARFGQGDVALVPPVAA